MAGIALLGGLVLGLVPRSVDEGFDSTKCGSVLKPEESTSRISDAITGDDTSGDCHTKLSDAKPYMLGAFGLAGVALIGAFIASDTRER